MGVAVPPVCSLFPGDGRSVVFINRTGRPVLLSSQAEAGPLGPAWSASVLLPPNTAHPWRFLGDSALLLSDLLLLLPELYSRARNTTFHWEAEYVDTEPGTNSCITFNKTAGPLWLASLPGLAVGAAMQVVLQADCGVPPLSSLAREASAACPVRATELPAALLRAVTSLRSGYSQIETNQLHPCPACREIHQYNLRQDKREKFFIVQYINKDE